MKKLRLVLVLAMLVAGGAVGAVSMPAYAQVYAGYNYPAPPQNPYATPWVGSNTPWVYYNGDWFLKGILYNFFGPKYGWAPYYAYAPTYIVRPTQWYAPMWHAWYQGNPHYRDNFIRTYPYWRSHQQGHRYDRNFYDQHHRGQGAGWHKGYHGDPRPEVRRPDKGRSPHQEGRRPDNGQGPQPDGRR